MTTLKKTRPGWKILDGDYHQLRQFKLDWTLHL